MVRIHQKGQTTFEYIFLIVVVLAAFMTVSVYFKRGIQGRWKSTADDLGDQYDPRVTNSSITHTLQSDTTTVIDTEDVGYGTWTRRTDNTNSVERKSGSMTVGAAN